MARGTTINNLLTMATLFLDLALSFLKPLLDCILKPSRRYQPVMKNDANEEDKNGQPNDTDSKTSQKSRVQM